MKRDHFVFYGSWAEAAHALSEAARGEFLCAVVDYGLYGEENEINDATAKICFNLVKPYLDANYKRYLNGCKGGEFGKLGGAPKGNKNAQKKQPQTTAKSTPKQPQRVEVNNPKTTPNSICSTISKDISEHNIKENIKRKDRPQSVEDVADYIEDYAAKHNLIAAFSAQAWWDHYTSNGWLVGRNKMRDWKAAVRTWFNTRSYDNGSNKQNNTPGAASVTDAVNAATLEAYNTIKLRAATADEQLDY